MRKNDTLIITEVDRLGRNKNETVKELRLLYEKEVRVMILEIPTTLQDVSAMNNTMAKMVLETINHMLFELYATMAQAAEVENILANMEVVRNGMNCLADVLNRNGERKEITE